MLGGLSEGDHLKKQLPTTKRARSLSGWRKHLRKPGKRIANKGTRRALKGIGREAQDT